MIFRQLIDFETNTYTYLIADEKSKEAVIFDSVIEQVERDTALIKRLELKLEYSIETHVHADHITGAAKLREIFACKTLVPQNSKVSCSHGELKDGDEIKVGEITIKTIATPGHTNAHNAYLINNRILISGDSLFINGCGRTDFQSGSSSLMYDSVINKLFILPDDVLVYPGHDYKGFTVSTIGEERKFNPRFLEVNEAQFIDFMSNLNLPNPKKIMEAVAANQKCGDQ